MTHLTEQERDELAELMGASVAPLLTYAVQMRDEQMTRDLLTGLGHQELLGLAVALAARGPISDERTMPGLRDQLRRERVRQRLTQAQLAEAAGYAHNTIHLVERGRQGVFLDTVADCAQALGLRLALVPGEAS